MGHYNACIVDLTVKNPSPKAKLILGYIAGLHLEWEPNQTIWLRREISKQDYGLNDEVLDYIGRHILNTYNAPRAVDFFTTSWCGSSAYQERYCERHYHIAIEGEDEIHYVTSAFSCKYADGVPLGIFCLAPDPIDDLSIVAAWQYEESDSWNVILSDGLFLRDVKSTLNDDSDANALIAEIHAAKISGQPKKLSAQFLISEDELSKARVSLISKQ